MMKKFFAAALVLALSMVMLSGMAALAAETDSFSAQSMYKIEVDGLKGKVTRLINSGETFEDMYVRYAVSYKIEGELLLMIDLIDVKWDEGKTGVSGTFRIPKIQTTGTLSGECYMLTTDEYANGKPVHEVVENTYGFLIK